VKQCGRSAVWARRPAASTLRRGFSPSGAQCAGPRASRALAPRLRPPFPLLPCAALRGSAGPCIWQEYIACSSAPADAQLGERPERHGPKRLFGPRHQLHRCVCARGCKVIALRHELQQRGVVRKQPARQGGRPGRQTAGRSLRSGGAGRSAGAAASTATDGCFYRDLEAASPAAPLLRCTPASVRARARAAAGQG
jgi:hypothetical protein